MNRKYSHMSLSDGFTLVELITVVAVIGLLAAIAMPFLSGYISDSHKSVLTGNIQTIRLFEKNYELQHKVYMSGTYDPANPGASTGLKARIGWEPKTSIDKVTYVATCQTPDADPANPACARGSGYYVTATDNDGTTACVAFEGASCP